MDQLNKWVKIVPGNMKDVFIESYISGFGKYLGESSIPMSVSVGSAFLIEGLIKGLGTALAFLIVFGIIAMFLPKNILSNGINFMNKRTLGAGIAAKTEQA